MATLTNSTQSLSISGHTLPHSSGNGLFCAWIKSADPIVTDSRIVVNLSNSNDSKSAFRAVVGKEGTEGGLEVWARNDGNSGPGFSFVLDGDAASPHCGWSFVELFASGNSYMVRVNRSETAYSGIYQEQDITLDTVHIGSHPTKPEWFWNGEIVEAALFDGIPTDEELDTLYNGGTPIVGAPTTLSTPVWAYWPLTSHANDTVNNKHLSWTGTPIYGSTHDLFNPRLTIRDEVGCLTEDIADGQTIVPFDVLLPKAGLRVAIGAEFPSNQNNVPFDIVTATNIKTSRVDAGGNLAHSQGRTVFEDGFVFDSGSSDKSKVIRGYLKINSGQANRMIVRWGEQGPSTSRYPWAGPYEVQLTGGRVDFNRTVYKGSSGFWADGKFVEIDSNTSRDGGLNGSNDDKHLSCSPVLFETAQGDAEDYVFAVWSQGHSDDKTFGRKLPVVDGKIDFANAGPIHLLASGGKFTYGIVFKGGPNRTYNWFRGDGNNKEQPSLLRVDNCHEVPVPRLDVLWQAWPTYSANAVMQDGLVIVSGQDRNWQKSKAKSLLLAIYDPDADIWYNPANVASSPTVGTAANPRFGINETLNSVDNGGCAILTEATGTYRQQYNTGGLLVDTKPWFNGDTISALAPYIYSDQTVTRSYYNAPPLWQDSYADAELKIRRWIGGVADDMPNIPEEIAQGPGNAYRMESYLAWKDNNPATNVAYGIFPIRGRLNANQPTDRSGAENPVHQYADWGCDQYALYAISNPFGNAQWSRVGEVNQKYGGRLGFPQPVVGAPNTFTVRESVGQVGWAWAHAQVYEFHMYKG